MLYRLSYYTGYKDTRPELQLLCLAVIVNLILESRFWKQWLKSHKNVNLDSKQTTSLTEQAHMQ